MGCAESKSSGADPRLCPVEQKSGVVSRTGDKTAATVDSNPGTSAQQDTSKPPTASLYERLGGAAAVDAAVDIFYNRIEADPELAPFFGGIDMQRQRRKQAAFLEFAFGGSKQYGGRTLHAAHRKLIQEKGLVGRHFDLVAGHLVATLEQLNVPQNLTNEVLTVVAPTKAMIFGEADA